MWVSKKKWEALEKRVADLEGRVQGQRSINIDAMVQEFNHRTEELLKESNEQALY